MPAGGEGRSVGQVSDFGSGHDLKVCEFEPRVGLSAVSAKPALDPLSPSLSLCPSPAHALSLSLPLKNKIKQNEDSNTFRGGRSQCPGEPFVTIK